MLKRNITIAIRSLKKDLSFAITNLVGLSMGIACCLLILSFVNYELSFDQFHAKKDRIYRVNYDVLMGGSQTISPSVPVFVAPELKKKFPEVEDVTRFLPEWKPRTIRHGEVFFDEKNFCYADPNFFKIFDFKSVSGDVNAAMSRPNSLVITRSMAKKYFGKDDPIGQTILFNNKKEYLVGAVVENTPANSTFTFDFLASLYSTQGFDSLETKVEWNNPNYSTFLLVKPGARVSNLAGKIEAWINPPSEASGSASQNALHLRLEPLKAIHFNTQVFNFANKLAVTDPKYIGIFIAIAILILLIACANYINLATAKASLRGKEVGIRKTIGAGFWQVFSQFIGESFSLIFLAIVIALAAVYFLLPSLNNLLGKEIPFYIFQPKFLLGVIGGWFLVSILAGSYPALVLSRFRPVETLKGNYARTGRSGLALRQSLVAFQFCISLVLILGTLIVRSQLSFMQSQKLGLDKEHVIMIRGNTDLNDKMSTFSAELRKISGVEDVTLAWRSPFETVTGNGFSIKANPTSSDDWHVVGGIAGDDHYLSTLGISLLAGRNFDPSKIRGDSTINEFIVNEAFLRHYRLKPEEALDKNVNLGLVGTGPIVGVMKDFHTSSFHSAIEPVVLFNGPDFFGSLLVRIGPGQMSSVVSKIGRLWQTAVPMRPFSYSFLDDEYDAMYRTEQRLETLMSVFGGMAILITCLGLLGLVAFMVTQRTKEIGIRKVLGASVPGIAAMISKDFLKLVLIAFVIATPVAYYFMHKWLQDFVYRVNIDWWIFVLAGLIAFLIAVLTVSFQAIKAAIANPVNSLRSE